MSRDATPIALKTWRTDCRMAARWKLLVMVPVVLGLLTACTPGAVLDVSIEPATATLTVAEVRQLVATVTVSGNAPRAVRWSSSEPDVASIDDVGLVTARTPGLAWITARSVFDARRYATMLVTVTLSEDDPCFAATTLDAASSTTLVSDRIVVLYRPSTTASAAGMVPAETAASAVVEAFGGRRVTPGAGPGSSVFDVPPEHFHAILEELRRRPEVAHAIPDLPMVRMTTPNDPLYLSSQWNLSGFGAEAAWAVADGRPAPDPPVVIAIVDDGMAVDHPDLAAIMLPGWDAHDLDSDPRNRIDHGTHVAGIAAAVRNNGLGVAGAGSTNGIRLLPVKAWKDTSDPFAVTSFSVVRRAVMWAAGISGEDLPPNPYPADVINLSLGVSASSVSAAEAAAFAELLQSVEGRGVTVVSAAGNATSPTSANAGIDFPARAGGVAVGSVDSHGGRSWFSKFCFGPTLMAPGGFESPSGQAIVSTTVSYVASNYLHDYGTKAGTSMATPYVAGAVALLIAAEPSLRGDPDAIRARLVAAASLRPGGSAAEYGAGILCLDALLGTGTVCGVP